MPIGPVQLVVLGFSKPDFQGEILGELQRLRDNDLVRVIDALAVWKDAQGEVAALEMSQLSNEEAVEFGATIGALVGLGAVGEEGVEAGAEAATDGINVFTEEDAWDVLAEIPEDSAAALILLEHRWAIPLRNAVARAGGFRLASEFVSALDLVEFGLVTAEEAEALASTKADAL